MENYFLNIPVSNIYTKPNIRSEISTQILYGEKFKILNKKKGWLKIKTYFDLGYTIKQLSEFFQRTPVAITIRLGKLGYDLDGSE